VGEHYFSDQPQGASRPREWQARLRGRVYRFRTDRGMFSPDHIDPGTLLLIETMEVRPGETVLDLGCGYGALGIAAAPLAAPARVYLTEVNRRAAALAEQNLGLNGIENAEVRIGDGLEPVADLRFDVILTNPPIRAGYAVVFPLLEQAADHLAPGGRLWLVARVRQGAKTLAAKLGALGLEVREVERKGGYRVYQASKP
jgi:16S rRNA (guanine1207-N2)-methyltransferase